MKIVDFTKQISISSSFTKLTLRHIELQKDKVSFPEPDKFNYNWSDPKNLMCQMMDQGYLLGKVLLDDSNNVQGYALYTYDKNPMSNVLTLYVMAIIVAEEYVNTFWAGKLVTSVVNLLQNMGVRLLTGQ